MSSITFIFEEFETKFPCKNTDFMEYLCNKYSNFIHKSLNDLFFSYNGNQVNFNLSFEQIAEGNDKTNNNMTIFVITKENKEVDKNNNEISNKNDVNDMKAKIMYDELIIKYGYLKNMVSEKDLIKKIKELNYNEIEIKNFYEKVKQLYEDLEDEYGVSGFASEEAVEAKIIELNFNRDLINVWIENSLIYGN